MTDAQSKAPEDRIAEIPEWRCFFCDEVFTSKETAIDHFGSDEGCYSDGPACKLNELEGGLLKFYREALDEIDRLRQEDAPSHREFYALGAEHTTALMREEEKGYARGLADGRSELTASQSRERALTEERDGLAASLTHVEKDAAIKQSALIEENSALTSENKALKELLTKVRGSIHITLRKFDEGAWGELGQRSSISVFRERLVGIDAALQQSHGGGE